MAWKVNDETEAAAQDQSVGARVVVVVVAVVAARAARATAVVEATGAEVMAADQASTLARRPRCSCAGTVVREHRS